MPATGGFVLWHKKEVRDGSWIIEANRVARTRKYTVRRPKFQLAAFPLAYTTRVISGGEEWQGAGRGKRGFFKFLFWYRSHFWNTTIPHLMPFCTQYNPPTNTGQHKNPLGKEGFCG